MRLLTLLPFFILITFRLQAQSCNCESVFERTREITEQNYAGWFDKVTQDTRASYDKWNEAQLLKIKQAKSDSACAIQLRQWVSFFKDKNLDVSFVSPRWNADGTLHNNEAPPVLKFNISEQQLRHYIGSSRSLDPIEGIYKNADYTVGVVRAEKQRYLATIISTTNTNWKPEEVKFVLEKKDNVYYTAFYNEEKTDSIHQKAKLVDNILDLETAFFEKIFPEPEQKRDLFEYEMANDPFAPKLEFKGAHLAVWRFPAFKNNSFAQTEYLLKKHAPELDKATDWIIDLRDNNEGDYLVGMQLMKYIYTGPVVKSRSEMRMTPGNLAAWQTTYIKPVYIKADQTARRSFDSLFAVMKLKDGSFFNSSSSATDTIRMAKPAGNTKRIAILINKNTKGAAEHFTLLCRQSKKVKVFGQVSGGAADYTNVVAYSTGCSTARLSLPVDRMLWLNNGFSVDKAGIHPDRLFVADDWVGAVLKEWKAN